MRFRRLFTRIRSRTRTASHAQPLATLSVPVDGLGLAGELRAVHEAMRRMLKENGPPPEGRFADLRYLEPVRDAKGRHASTMLTFDAVVDAIGQIEARRTGG